MFSPAEIEKMEGCISQKSLLPTQLYIIGHRGMGLSNQGFADAMPENTIESFKQAIILGADGIEMDVFETKDGHLLVIHDDELWKNVYGMDRDGLALPEKETQDSFCVSKKNLSDLLGWSVGPDGQKAPKLMEVFDLVEEANSIRAELGQKPLILNIDIKSPSVATKCIEWIEDRVKNEPASTIDFDVIYFTSSSEQTLKKLIEMRVDNDRHIKIVPQINTKQIFGLENTDDKYLVKNRMFYNAEFLNSLKVSINENKFVGVDCVLWDVNEPLLQLCKNEGLQLHVYPSNFKHFHDYSDFVFFIFYTSQFLALFLKVDDVEEVVSILNRHAIDDDYIRKQKSYFLQRLPLSKPFSS